MLPFAMSTLGQGASVDPDARAYFAKLTTQPSAARKKLINNLIVGLKKDNLWSKFSFIYLFAQETLQGGTINVVSPTLPAISTQGITYTTDRGWAMLGISSGIQLGSYSYQQSDTQYSFWKYQYNRLQSYSYIVGTDQSTTNYSFFETNGNGSEYDLNGSYYNGTFTANTGFQTVNTTASQTTYYYNGAACATLGTSGNTLIYTKPFSAFRCDQYADYSYGYPNGSVMSWLAMSKSMTAAESLNYYNRVKTYMIGAGVTS